ncbi:MAG: rhodanese-like domain-containing protein [Nitrospirae bacterium]|nr:rhodanese-like domain-containing protein [Nitrospirota bacterium]
MKTLKCVPLMVLAVLVLTGVCFADWPDSVTQKIDVIKGIEQEKKEMPASLEGVTILNGDEVYKLWKSKKAVVLDTRNKVQYDTEKIEGAMHLSADELLKNPALADGFDKEKEYVLYCNGIKCPRSPWAAIMLQHLGFKKLDWYRDGMPDWKSKGYPTE